MWVINETDANIGLMSKTLGIDPVTARVMANRGIRTKNTAIKFLNPDLRFLNREQMRGMSEAVRVIRRAVAAGERIVVYGDYDADGVCGTVILLKALGSCGADVDYYIPHREEEGYGLTLDAVARLSGEADVLLCCDNGIAALNEILVAKKTMKVVVIDHHEPVAIDGRGEILPLADAIVDPKQSECGYPFKELCAAGLAYKFAGELYAAMGRDFAAEERELLVFAMLATICDVVDLNGENRILAKNGLRVLNEEKDINLGLGRLIKDRGYENKDLSEQTVGFVIGPCINASGRLAHAGAAVELFLTEDPDEAAEKSRLLVRLNEERKEVTERAYTRVMEGLTEPDRVLVVYDDSVHESVAGIVAGRVRERVHRPTMILTRSGGLVKGSGRSVPGYNMYEELGRFRELFVKFGGHPMAAGFSLEESKVELLRQRLNEACTREFEPVLEIDCEIGFSEVTYALATELQRLAPFGKGNHEPVFLTRGVKPEAIRVIADKRTIIFTIGAEEPYRQFKALCFGMVDRFRESIEERYGTADKIFAGVLRGSELTMDLAYTVEIDGYSGNHSVQLRIRDFRVW